MRAILIDPAKRSVTEIDTPARLKDIYALLRCERIEAVYPIPDTLVFVDEEGLLADEPGPFFEIVGHPQPLAGRGLMFGLDEKNQEHIALKLPLKHVSRHVRFPDIEFVGFQPFTSEIETVFGEPAAMIGNRAVFRPKEKAEPKKRERMRATIVADSELDSVNTVDALHEHALAFVENCFAAHDRLPIRWWLRLTDRRVVVIDTPWQSEWDKNYARFIVAKMLSLLDAEAYAFAAETFIHQYDPKTGIKKITEDCVFITTNERNGESRITRYGVQNAGTVKARLLARDDWATSATPGVEVDGPMMNLFKAERNFHADEIVHMIRDYVRAHVTPQQMLDLLIKVVDGAEKKMGIG